MDLGAYVQISDLEPLAKLNNIEIPRLRGYRLMKDEKPMLSEEIDEIVEEAKLDTCEWFCCSVPSFTESNLHSFGPETDKIRKKYMVYKNGKNSLEGIEGFRWGRCHGKKRKRLKFALKKKEAQVRKQYEMFNKYAGREDVLYIHARIGGLNWEPYGGPELEKADWFLEKVDDYFDDTYCDIYCKLAITEILKGD